MGKVDGFDEYLSAVHPIGGKWDRAIKPDDRVRQESAAGRAQARPLNPSFPSQEEGKARCFSGLFCFLARRLPRHISPVVKTKSLCRHLQAHTLEWNILPAIQILLYFVEARSLGAAAAIDGAGVSWQAAGETRRAGLSRRAAFDEVCLLLWVAAPPNRHSCQGQLLDSPPLPIAGAASELKNSGHRSVEAGAGMAGKVSNGAVFGIGSCRQSQTERKSERRGIESHGIIRYYPGVEASLFRKQSPYP